jgi:hypothetical protein
MTTATPYSDPGRASFEEIDTYVQNHLLSGAEPPLQPAIGITVAAGGNDLAQFQVVGRNGDGDLVEAVIDEATPANSIKPIGVLAHAAAAGETGQVWYSGCFDPAALVWDASFNTDALKAAAFEGSPTPTTILVRKR